MDIKNSDISSNIDVNILKEFYHVELYVDKGFTDPHDSIRNILFREIRFYRVLGRKIYAIYFRPRIDSSKIVPSRMKSYYISIGDTLISADEELIREGISENDIQNALNSIKAFYKYCKKDISKFNFKNVYSIIEYKNNFFIREYSKKELKLGPMIGGRALYVYDKDKDAIVFERGEQ